MGSKVSELQTLNDQEYANKLDEGLIPVVIEDNLGNKINKKFTLLDYWTKVLLKKVADECERHKSIYNFGGEVTNTGSGSESGSGGGSGSGEETGVDPVAWLDVQDKVSEMYPIVTTLNSHYYPFSAGEQLRADFNSFLNGYTEDKSTLSTSIQSNSDAIASIDSALGTAFYIKVLDPSNALVKGYKYSPKNGLSEVTNFPGTGVIELRTEAYATALYHLELSTAVSANYDTQQQRYIVALGTLILSKPSGVTTTYTGGALTDHYVTITPSWDNTTTASHEIRFTNNIDCSGTYNDTYSFASESDNLIDNAYLIIVVKIGNWSQTFTVTKDMVITGNVSKDIISAA